MPIYEYQCQKCGHQLEELQKIAEAPLTICPKCNEAALTKLISHTSFQLKGTGWYVTDFKDKKKPTAKPKVPPKQPSSKPEAKKSEKPPANHE